MTENRWDAFLAKYRDLNKEIKERAAKEKAIEAKMPDTDFADWVAFGQEIGDGEWEKTKEGVKEKIESGKWPVPCPNEGDGDGICSECWANNCDAIPYCDTPEYIERCLLLENNNLLPEKEKKIGNLVRKRALWSCGDQ